MVEIEPRLLRYFLAVAEELNFNRAAERIRVSQPSLSVAIRKLEMNHGVQLFDRNVHRVELTDDGRRFLPIARDLLERNRAAVAYLEELARGEPEIFRVGYSPFLDLGLIGDLRSRVQALETVPVEFVSLSTARQMRRLLAGELHAGLLVPSDPEPAIAIEVLRREPFLIAFPKNHRFEDLKRLSVDDIREEPVIWFARHLNTALSERFFTSCNQAGYAPRIVQEVTTVLECMHFVAQGMGISFAARSLEAARFDGVSFRELSDYHFSNDTALAYRRDQRMRALERFVRVVRDRFDGLSWVEIQQTSSPR